MPELPEVETVRLGLVPVLEKHRIAGIALHRNGLRSPFAGDFAATLQGARVVRLRRRAKYILADLDNGHTWLVHLGMSGSFRTITAKKPFVQGTHDHVVITLDDGLRLIYTDPRRFGQMEAFASSAEATHPALSKLGPEPLDESFNGAVLAARLKGKKIAIKIALLDQRVVAGVGNIYACEALFKAGIDPTTQAGTLPATKTRQLATAIRQVMKDALASGGSTLRDHRQLDGSTGYFQHNFAVYGHEGEPCGNCTCKGKQSVRTITQGGRTTFFCPVKQL